MSEKKLSEELRHCLEDGECRDCVYYDGNTVMTCRGLLQKAYEVVKRYEDWRNYMDIVFGNQEVFWGIDMDYIENPIREISVDNSERMTWYDGWETVVLKGADENGLDWEFSPEDIGKTVFQTKESAEKALKEMEDGKNGEVDK